MHADEMKQRVINVINAQLTKMYEIADEMKINNFSTESKRIIEARISTLTYLKQQVLCIEIPRSGWD